ncbi:MAG: WD40 repeat domain-containing protein, partial [Verrucomicrobiota bacterium]
MADPAGILNVENGITDAEGAEFDPFGRLLITCSKADGRHPSLKHGKSAHLTLWEIATGAQIWDRLRSRGPDENGDGLPDDQPNNREDEIEIAIWSPDGRFVAAGAEDDAIEIWRVRADDQGPDEWLTEPELVKTLTTGDGDQETDDAGIDCLTWSHDGRFILAGTEEGGRIEVYLVTGAPEGWRRIHKARHGGRPGWAVNSLDMTEDDRYVGAAGTDTKGSFWRFEVAEGKDGEVKSVSLSKIATLPSKNGKPIDGSGREARFEPDGDRHLILTFERTGLVQVYDVAALIAWDGPASEGPDPVIIYTNGERIKDGNEIEPAVYTPDGRFLIHDGDTRVNGSTEGIFPGFIRVVDTTELGPDLPMPDPIVVVRALATEFLDVSMDGTLLASGHG